VQLHVFTGQGFDCRGYSEQPRRTLCWTSSGGAQGILRRSLAAVWLPVRGEDPRLALAVEECHFALVKPFSRLPQSFQRNPIWLSQALGRCAGPGRRPIPVGGSPRWRSASFLPGVKQERYCALFRRHGSSVEPDHARKWDPVTLKAADGTWHVRRWIRDRDCSKAFVQRHWRSGNLLRAVAANWKRWWRDE